MNHRWLAVVLVLGLSLPASVATPQSSSSEAGRLGTVNFPVSCTQEAQLRFTRGVAMLHSFWLDVGITEFTDVTQADVGCGIAYWGIAMAWMGNPLAGPPSPSGLKEGWAAVEKAKLAGAKTHRERDWIAAIENIYKDADKLDHRTRAVAYEKAMAELSARYPDDREARRLLRAGPEHDPQPRRQDVRQPAQGGGAACP